MVKDWSRYVDGRSESTDKRLKRSSATTPRLMKSVREGREIYSTGKTSNRLYAAIAPESREALDKLALSSRIVVTSFMYSRRTTLRKNQYESGLVRNVFTAHSGKFPKVGGVESYTKQ
jgi:hypothetical protein